MFPEPPLANAPVEEVEKPIVLSTAPSALPTHWEQGVIHLPGLIGPADGSAFLSPPLMVVMKKSSENHRNYDISVESM